MKSTVALMIGLSISSACLADEQGGPSDADTVAVEMAAEFAHEMRGSANVVPDEIADIAELMAMLVAANAGGADEASGSVELHPTSAPVR